MQEGGWTTDLGRLARWVGLIWGVLLPALCFAQYSWASEWLQGPPSTATSVAYSPNGRYLVEGANASIQVFNVLAGTVKSIPIPNPAGTSCWAISPDSRSLAIGEQDAYSGLGTVLIWDLATAKLRSTLTINGTLTPQSILYTPDGKSLIIGTGQILGYGQIFWIDAVTGVEKRTLNLSGSAINRLTLAKNGSELAFVATVSAGYSVEVLDVSSGTVIQSIPIAAAVAGPNSPVYTPSIALSPDASLLAIGSVEPLATWSVATGKIVQQFYPNETSSQTGVAFSTDGKVLASFGYGVGVALFNVTSGATLSNLSTDANDTQVCALSYSASGNSLAVVAASPITQVGTSIQVWNPTSGKLQSHITAYLPNVTSNATYSPDGSQIAAGAECNLNGATSEQVIFWDPVTGAQVNSLTSDLSASISGIAFSPNGKLLAAVGQKVYGKQLVPTVDIWYLPTGERVKSWPLPGLTSVNEVIFTPDSKSVIGGGSCSTGPGIQQLAVANGNALMTLRLSGTAKASSLSVSPNGKLLAVGFNGASIVLNEGYGSATVYNLVTHTSLGSLPTYSGGGVGSVAFSPDGTKLACAGFEWVDEGQGFGNVPFGQIEIFDASTLQLLSRAKNGVGYAGGIPTLVAFSADGKVVFANPGSLMELETTDLSEVGWPSTETLTTFALSPWGQVVAMVLPNGGIQSSTTPSYSPPVVTGFNVSPSSLKVGDTATATVNVSWNLGALTLPISNSNSFVQAPTSVTIPPGQTTGTFKFTVAKTPPVLAASMSVTLNGQTQAGHFNVNEPTITGFAVSSTSVTGGATVTGTITMNERAPAGGLPIEVSGSLVLGAGTQWVSIPAGQTSVTFTFQTPTVTSPTTGPLIASFGGDSYTLNLSLH